MYSFFIGLIIMVFFFNVALEKLYGPHDGPCHLSTIPPIPLKDSHLFIIAVSSQFLF